VLKDHSADANNNSSIVANVERGDSTEALNKYVNSNLNTLIKFKKTLLEEQKTGEEKVDSLNQSIESTKKEIDKQRMDLEELRTQLKKVNEIKESEYARFIENIKIYRILTLAWK